MNNRLDMIIIPAWRYVGAVPTPKLEPLKDVCDACGSAALIKVKGCVRCETCGYKNDCNGW